MPDYYKRLADLLASPNAPNATIPLSALGQLPPPGQSLRPLRLAEALMGGAPAPNAMQRNAPYVAPNAGTNYNTSLPPAEELEFRSWVQQNNVPFNANAGVTDYDMRGFFRALKSGDPRAASAVNPNDNRMHYPDYWKTPLHQTFSQDSQWAGPVAPRWNELDQLVSPGGRILYDERKR